MGRKEQQQRGLSMSPINALEQRVSQPGDNLGPPVKTG